MHDPDERDDPRAGLPDMRAQWDERARENARFYIATTNHESEEAFDLSGRRDVEIFFAGHEDLLGPDVTALDVGCGIGRMDRHVAPRVGRLLGLDVSPEMVRRAKERLADLCNVAFLVGDGVSLRPIADASLDLVFSHVVFQHVPRRVVAGYAREAHRVLRPGGTFLFQLPERRPDSPPDPPDDDTFSIRFWSEEEARRVVEEAGFTVERVRRECVHEVPPIVVYLQLRARRPRGFGGASRAAGVC